MAEPNTTEIILYALSVIGVGGVITYFLNKRKELQFQVIEQKQRRYKSCLTIMEAYLVPESIKYLSSRQPDIDDAKDVLAYLELEYYEMMFYASRAVVLAVKEFIDKPSREKFLNAILNMRQDLWVKKKDLNLDELQLKTPHAKNQLGQ
ncbi:MAG TPA: hypothetical protein VFA55_02230 [Candidatus Kapabacteria bacterium]|nr:hypothetical protein [Candidatus Kapabacteria bacterium]